MRQVVFVKKNEDKWNKAEAFNRGRLRLNADELATYYIEITDDLSYAQTFYPKSPIIEYLNQIAFDLHTKIYKNKKEDKNRFLNFWKVEVPMAISKYDREFKFSLFVFMVGVIIGLFSSAQDGEFVRLILGDRYVNMTLENIAAGDPMAVYKGESEARMFLGIGINNIRVSFLAFALGILGSVFTGFILFSNGIMVGAFIYFFIRAGVFGLTFTTIMIHGTLELSAIVIAGAAGMIMGNSWMFPGTYERSASLVQGARDAIKIIIGLVPVFVVAAFIESYVTRHYLTLGMTGRVMIMVISAAYIIWYFVIYPKNVMEKSLNLTYLEGETKIKTQ